MRPNNWGEPMGAPAIFEKQIKIKLLHPVATLKSRIQVLTTLVRPFKDIVIPSNIYSYPNPP
ncbi:MAG: hypothetical protein P8X74_11665 [Reinekea sp.]